MKNPCNDIKIGCNTVSSYNAGYHRGLNTEYHDVPIEVLFKKWVEEKESIEKNARGLEFLSSYSPNESFRKLSRAS